jgi:hypothetical protein
MAWQKDGLPLTTVSSIETQPFLVKHLSPEIQTMLDGAGFLPCRLECVKEFCVALPHSQDILPAFSGPLSLLTGTAPCDTGDCQQQRCLHQAMVRR